MRKEKLILKFINDNEGYNYNKLYDLFVEKNGESVVDYEEFIGILVILAENKLIRTGGDGYERITFNVLPACKQLAIWDNISFYETTVWNNLIKPILTSLLIPIIVTLVTNYIISII